MDVRYVLARYLGMSVYLRHERKPEWKAELPIYAIWCPDCERIVETYPAGHRGRLECGQCRFRQYTGAPAYKDGERRRRGALPYVFIGIIAALLVRACLP